MHKDTRRRLETYPNIRECSIQTFNDQDKNERSQSRILEMTDENIEKCIKLQKLMPYWIFFSVQPMEKGKRDKSSVKFIQAWQCDIDTGTKEEQLKLIENAPLTPTYVNESVHGFHLFYISTEHLTEQQFIDGNTGLMEYYHWDPKVVKDTARVLRLPGFYHNKGDPVLVQYRDDLSCGESYTPSQMSLAFPFHQPQIDVPKPEVRQTEKTRSDDDSYWQKVNNLDTKDMLLNLSGSKRVAWEIISFRKYSNGEQIICNGKETWCWLDTNRLIGSWDHGWPTRVQWVEWYLKRKLTKSEWHELSKEIDKWYPQLAAEKNKGKVRKFDIKSLPVVEDRQRQSKWFFYPSEVFDDFDCFMSWELVTIIAETNAGKTTFAMDMVKRNSALWSKCLYINLEFDLRTYRQWVWLAFHNKNKRDVTDKGNLTDQEREDMEAYINTNLSQYESYSNPNGIDLDELEQLITDKAWEGFEMFVIDTFSRIHGNLDWMNSRGYQNRCMEELQELVQKLNVAIVMLHHTNKEWKFEGTQKIKDLSNVFITIEREENQYGESLRKYILSKDKFVHNTEITARFNKWKYERVYH